MKSEYIVIDIGYPIWLRKFRNLNDVKLAILLVSKVRNGSISFTELDCIMTASYFNVSVKSIKNSIESLIDSGFIKRKTSKDYLANPNIFKFDKNEWKSIE